MSSTQAARWGKSSLTAVPEWPYRLKLKGDPSTIRLIWKTVAGVSMRMGWPLSFCSLGLGSKVSICDGPPSMKRKITDLALGGW